MKKNLFFTLVIFLLALDLSARISNSPKTSANHKYYDLIQTINCPSDKATYGRFNDYGYWGGGAWCGNKGQAGFWVYSYPNWYVWSGAVKDAKNNPEISENGKYTRLIQTIYCPKDLGEYGKHHDSEYWEGGPWCEVQGKEGYWVWDYPYWYVWSKKSKRSWK